MKKLFLILLSIAVIQGCYNPTYTTTQGVDVFCHYGNGSCPSQTNLEYALAFFAANSPDYLGWPIDNVKAFFPGTRLYFQPEQPACGEEYENGCAGTIRPNGPFVDVKIQWMPSGKISDTALIREYAKFAIIYVEGVFDMESYDSPLWEAAGDLNSEYARISGQ